VSWTSDAMGIVCPAKPLKKVTVVPSDNVWQLNLDQVESNSGNVLAKVRAPYSDAGNSTHWFDARHVLYSKLRPYLNKVVLPDEQGLATTELVPLLPDQKRLDRKYLAYYLRSNEFVNWVNGQVAGAKMPRVSMKVFWEHEIPLPPLPEQNRLVAILDKADAIRRKRQHAIQLADQFLRAVFLDMFGDPVTNPKGWEVKTLKDITSKIGSGATPRGGKEAYHEEGVSLIRSLNVHDDLFLLKNLAFINDDQASKLSNVAVEEQDVLLNITGASVCRCCIVYHKILPARVNQHVCVIRTNKGILNSEYLLHTLISSSYKRKLLNLATSGGATREALTKLQVKQLELPVPPFDLQEEFSKINKAVKSSLGKMKCFSNETFFESLSQKAFSGDL